MTGRPEALFPLFASLEGLEGIGPKTARLFTGLGVSNPRDLLFLLPQSGVDRRRRATVREVLPPEIVTVEVEVGAHMPARQRGRPYRVIVRDEAQEFQLVFFHAHADYLQRLLPTGQRRIVSGRIEAFDLVLQMVHPDHVLRPDEAEGLPAFEPVYPLTAGITQKLVTKAVAGALERRPDLPEWIDPALKRQMGWPNWRAALDGAHQPASLADLSPTHPARQRLAYDEVLAHQITLALARAQRRRAPGMITQGNGALRASALAALPYAPTSAQTRAMDEIAADMAAPRRMNRLLQGDVGAGKTLVALAALLTAVEAGGQGVLMAPTEILARQHLEGLSPLALAAGVRMELLTGRDKGRERATKLAALAGGEIGILVGTHAVFQSDVVFADLRLAVIDEQHRFGVAQRMALGEKGRRADVSGDDGNTHSPQSGAGAIWGYGCVHPRRKAPGAAARGDNPCLNRAAGRGGGASGTRGGGGAASLLGLPLGRRKRNREHDRRPNPVRGAARSLRRGGGGAGPWSVAPC
jgi:ATP-dependent DNA helicase RecG